MFDHTQTDLISLRRSSSGKIDVGEIITSSCKQSTNGALQTGKVINLAHIKSSASDSKEIRSNSQERLKTIYLGHIKQNILKSDVSLMETETKDSNVKKCAKDDSEVELSRLRPNSMFLQRYIGGIGRLNTKLESSLTTDYVLLSEQDKNINMKINNVNDGMPSFESFQAKGEDELKRIARMYKLYIKVSREPFTADDSANGFCKCAVKHVCQVSKPNNATKVDTVKEKVMPKRKATTDTSNDQMAPINKSAMDAVKSGSLEPKKPRIVHLNPNKVKRKHDEITESINLPAMRLASTEEKPRGVENEFKYDTHNFKIPLQNSNKTAVKKTSQNLFFKAVHALGN